MTKFFLQRKNIPWRIPLVILAFALLVGSRGSHAEVEIPIIENGNFVSADLNGVLGYYRSDRLTGSGGGVDVVDGADPVQRYEAWAVGKNLDASDLEKGVIYRFNGSTWQRYIPQKYCSANPTMSCDTKFDCANPATEQCTSYATQPLNAVGGMPNNAYPEMWFVGDNGLSIYAPNYYTEADYYFSSPYTEKKSELRGNTACGDVSNGPITSTNANYTVAGNTGFHAGAVMGGQNGVLYNHKSYDTYGKYCAAGGNSVVGNKCLTDADCNGTAGACKTNIDAWQRQCPTGFPNANEHVMGVAYSNNNIRYVVTTTAAAGADLTAIRNCSGAQTGRLYRYDTTTDNKGRMTLLASTGVCFFGLSTQTTQTIGPTNSRLLNTVWIATSNGMYKWAETDPTIVYPATGGGILTGPLAGTAGKKYYSVASQHSYSGPNANILQNGDFEAWSNKNPSSSTTTADEWLQWEGYGTHNDAGICDNNTQDVMVSTLADQGLYSLKVEPGVHFTENDAKTICPGNLPANQKTNFIAGVSQDIDLTTIDAQKFRVTGKYRVDFTNPTNPAPTVPQGGIRIACTGGAIGESAFSPDCAYSYFGGIRTASQGDTSTDPNADANGFLTFSVDLSNQSSQYNIRIPGTNGNPKVGVEGMGLQILCQATYGAKVYCDDIKVQPLDEPVQTASGNIKATVTSVGQDGSILRNDNAFASDTFTTESNPTATVGQNLYGTSIAQNAYMFAVGGSSQILQRGPSNINGYLWVGSGAPASLGRSGSGWISAGCINTHDSLDRTFCQRSPFGYGLNFENVGSQTTLFGRAWYGKITQSSTTLDSDSEQLSLGSCVNPVTSAATSSQPYKITGTCNTTTRTCAGHPEKACQRDFDCYGRCQNDAGFICLYNSDCTNDITCTAGRCSGGPLNGQACSSVASCIPSKNGSSLAIAPYDRLQCDASGGSPNACVGGGWLTFNYADFVGSAPGALESKLLGQRNYCGANVAACLDAANCPNGLPCQLKGIGQFLTPTNTNDVNGAIGRGWVSLRGTSSVPNPVTINSTPRLYACKSCASAAATPDPNDLNCGFCQDNSSQSCTPAANSCFYYCDADPTKPTCKSDADCLVVGASSTCKPAGRCSQDGTKTCSDDTDCSGKGYCTFGALCQPAAGNSCQRYGVNFDAQNQTFSGYGWSSDYGWIDFRFSRKGTTRFIQTRLGDIYSQKKIGDISTQPAPANNCNATYVISATGTIQNFCSSLTADSSASYSAIQPLSPFIPLNSQKNLYANALGRFDVTGMETVSETGTGSNPDKNKYGSSIYHLDSTNVNINAGVYKGITNDPTAGLNDLYAYTFLNNPLNNSVYIAGDNTTLSQTFLINRDFTFHNGSYFMGTGAGLIIINGNLRINGNIGYDTGSSLGLSDQRYLGNATILVRGDLIVDTKVTNIVGNYYVTGTVCTVPRNSFTGTGLGAGECAEPTPSGSVPNKFQLTVKGLMMAKKFVFGRRFTGSADDPKPSELFIYDGRVQANPMPGMTDFSASLPVDIDQN